MSSTNAPYGFRVAYHPNGLAHATERTIASAYATAIFSGDPVKLLADGTIALATSDGTRTGTVDTVNLLGIFAGVTYRDSDGRPVTRAYWPAGQVATDIKAYVYEEPDTVFTVQANGSIAATAIGDEADWAGFIAPGGSTATGRSSGVLSSTLVGAAGQGQFRIVGFDGAPDNAAGDSFTRVLVTIAEHQFRVDYPAV